MVIGPTLHRSVRTAARFCDANRGVRRHVLPRWVRAAKILGGIDFAAARTMSHSRWSARSRGTFVKSR